MNRVAVAQELMKIARSLVAGHDKEWDEILELLKTKKHYGNEEMVDFFAEVWNGGIQQWVENNHYKDLHAVLGVAQKMGPKGQELVSKLRQFDGVLEEYVKNAKQMGERYDEELADELVDKLEPFDDWFYGHDDPLVLELLEYMRQ